MFLESLLGTPQKSYRPYNVATGKPYQGNNIATLEAAAIKMRVINDPRWMTFLQAKELGYKVKKGEHGTRIEFWKFEDKEETENSGNGISKKSVLKRFYTVFHASQVEGIPALETIN